MELLELEQAFVKKNYEKTEIELKTIYGDETDGFKYECKNCGNGLVCVAETDMLLVNFEWLKKHSAEHGRN